MTDILILSIAVVWWVNLCPIMDLVKAYLRVTKNYTGRIKPFDCATCLGWWSGLVLGLNTQETLIMILATGILTSFFSVIIEKLYLILILR